MTGVPAPTLYHRWLGWHAPAMRRALTGKDGKAAAALLPKTFSEIDRSAKLGMIKKNTAARYKSKLHKKVKALAA